MHALVLSGGGANGAYEAGAAAAIIEHYKESNWPVELISGTSVGALNGAAIVSRGHLYGPDVWRALRRSDVYKKSPFLMPFWVFGQGSLYDSRPLRQLIADHVDQPSLFNSSYELLVHTTRLETGQRVTFTNRDDSILTGIYASCSIPGLFAPVEWQGMRLVDGSVVSNTPIRPVIQAGATKITVIHLSENRIDASNLRACDISLPMADRKRSLAVNLTWAFDTMISSQFETDLAMVRTINQIVNSGWSTDQYRFIDLQVLRPKSPLGEAFDFSSDHLKRMVDDGWNDAVAFVSK